MVNNDIQLSRDSRIFVAGHRGLVGAAIVRRLETLGCNNCWSGAAPSWTSANKMR
jgi:hypothetical protein